MSNTMIPQQDPATAAPIPAPPAGHAWTPGRTTSMILAVVLLRRCRGHVRGCRYRPRRRQ